MHRFRVQDSAQRKSALVSNAFHSLSPDSLRENVQCSSQSDHVYEIIQDEVDHKALDYMETQLSYPEERTLTLYGSPHL